mmetsp:Transcript_60024/g.147539  ORF Transcript_60024/g.147539 Transcript_60024/m.147539 type:complete len:364 (-) Transcript_60024:217-1308(-)|eukprot:CAMPEP_0113446400 /NCGR_PEP_ID=MMETSP0014_2-20120614/3686_1 /TAXON_ID=2857 /ORGANISM="Nitzschia sp." /LENGTH=363 /DNA_ID=CAMNT_0000337489 /DNA_START=476 /DNA_END=1567 /DNA_ORIENTATION=+ /assembly_acc=CAM_ASM_000159
MTSKMEDSLIVFECKHIDDRSRGRKDGSEAMMVDEDDYRSTVSSLTSKTENDIASLAMAKHPDGETFGNNFRSGTDYFEIQRKKCDNSIDDIGVNEDNEDAGESNSSQILPGVTSGYPRHISYAQLFFDPETKNLVTIMEINLPNRPDLFCGSSSSGSSNIILGHDEEADPSLGIQPFCRQVSAPRSCSGSGIFGGNTSGRDFSGGPVDSGGRGRWAVDETLLTECSSISSATSTTSHEDCRDDVMFSVSPSKEKKTKHEKDRTGFCYDGAVADTEPIIFSHNDLGELWFEENELSLYLLHDDGEPWETIGRKSGCTESLKKLLAASRSCISLRQLGMAVPNLSTNRQQQQKTPLVAYSALDN